MKGEMCTKCISYVHTTVHILGPKVNYRPKNKNTG